VKVGMGTVEKLNTIENIGIDFGILSLGCAEPELLLGVIITPNCNVRFKNTIATLVLMLYTHAFNNQSSNKNSARL